MTLQLSFDEQFDELRAECKSAIEIGENWSLFQSAFIPTVLDLEEACLYGTGPKARFDPDVIARYFPIFVAPNCAANERYFIPDSSVNKDAIIFPANVGLMCEMTIKEMKEGVKISGELTYRIPSGVLLKGADSYITIRQNISYKSAPYALTAVISEPPVERHKVSSVCIRMNDHELQRRLELKETPTEPVWDHYSLRRVLTEQKTPQKQP